MNTIGQLIEYDTPALRERASGSLPASPPPHLSRLVGRHQLRGLGQRPHTLPPGLPLVLNFLLS